MGYVPTSKKEIKHKKQSKFDKVREEELIVHGLFVPDSKRPFSADGVTSLKEAEFWRLDTIKEINEWIDKIVDPNLDEFRCREWNDTINKLVKHKKHWELRIKELGGPDYLKRSNTILDFGGVAVPGTKGYRYYGQAKFLPGVKELFEHAAKLQEKMTPEELIAKADCGYFGYRDEDDGALLAYETSKDEMERNLIAETYGVEFDTRDFISFPKIPSQKEVEEWLVAKRRETLEKKFLAGPSLDQNKILV